MRSRFPIWLAGGLVLLGGVVSVGRSQDRPQDWADHLPPGDGRALVATQCSSCHDLQSTVRQRQPRDWWETTVYDMVARGAPIFIDEADEIIAYLSRVFGPDAPPLTDINLASREQLQKLPGVTADLADRLIVHRKTNGPIRSREQLRKVLGLADAPFEKIQYYVRVTPEAEGS